MHLVKEVRVKQWRRAWTGVGSRLRRSASLLFRFRKRPHSESPKYGYPPLYAGHRTLFRTLLPNPTIHHIVQAHVAPLNSYHTSSLSFQIWTTSKSGAVADTAALRLNPQTSFRTPHQNYEGG